MGSSKKHKDDKERKHKHRHRDHDRSRSRSRDHKRKEDREKRDERDRDNDKRRKHDTSSAVKNSSESSRRSNQDTSGSGSSAVERKPPPVESKPTAASESQDSGAGLCISISDTNKLREKLGLAPLRETDAKQEGGGSATGPDSDVHAPPTNMAEVKRTEEIREKMLQAKEKRRINMGLGKVKPLAADSDDEDSAVAWVKRSRKIDSEKQRAAQMEKMLEDMDKDFGIGGLVAEAFSEKKPKYGSEDLKGLRVEHALEGFADERTTILVLKDRGILDEGDDADDTLINMNMVDNEKAVKNVETKKKKPDYKPYDEPEFDEYGMLKARDVLEKYNEEIDGVQKESFQLGRGGRYNAQHERQMRDIKIALNEQGQALTLSLPKVASEYYTHEEMASFKKRKKKVRAVRTRVTADDLLKIAGEGKGQNHGSRRTKGEAVDELAEDQVTEYKPDSIIEDIDMDLDDDQDEEDKKNVAGEYGPVDDWTGYKVDEELVARELEQSLDKARRLRVAKSQPKTVRVKTEVEDDAENEDEFPGSIQLYSTSEFCRSLGEIPTYGTAGNRLHNEDETMECEQEAPFDAKADPDDDEQGVGGAWQSVEIDSRPVEIKAEDKPVLNDEPVLNHGLAGALRLASTKGYLDAKEKIYTLHNPVLEAKNFSIEDKRYDDLDEKSRKRDRYSTGATMDFKEKEGYKPIIKLDYADEHGRPIPPKEAFRTLSHRFHGKGSGKKKTEKRMKKVEEAELMKFMSSTDTPLNTVHLLKEKQKADRMPYVILSGGKGIGANNIAK